MTLTVALTLVERELRRSLHQQELVTEESPSRRTTLEALEDSALRFFGKSRTPRCGRNDINCYSCNNTLYYPTWHSQNQEVNRKRSLRPLILIAGLKRNSFFGFGFTKL